MDEVSDNCRIYKGSFFRKIMNLLFICLGNVARSQMAEGFGKKYYSKHNIFSAGFSPINGFEGKKVGDFKRVTESMADKGIDVSNQIIKGITPDLVDKVDIVVLLDKGISSYDFRSKRIFTFHVDEPRHENYEGYCRIRDEIESNVLGLGRYLS